METQHIFNKDTIMEYLKEIKQDHIVEEYSKRTDEEKNELINQVNNLENIYPGGLREYIKRAQVLLHNSKNNINPFSKFTPSVPEGVNIKINDEAFYKYEALGVKELEHTGFVLVAGGLGERLGYNDIKIGIPTELVTKRSYFNLYTDYIKAYQSKLGMKDSFIPLCIMTSDDTNTGTIKLLEENNYFGLMKEQVTIVKQQKIPAMLDNDCHFALIKDKLLIDTKPHGHGDVHTLLYQHGVIENWSKMGKKWVVFFQDTNALIFNAVPSALGVSIDNSFVINSITIPRRPGEAVGAICKLTNEESGKTITLNVEYNQLDSLLREKWNPQGDITNEDGYSHFPGNTNVLVFQLEAFLATLKKTKGLMPEFVNPKYADDLKNVFKSPTRLECMMQDYPQLLEENEKVGFTMFDKWFVFSTCKNNLKDGVDKLKKNLNPETAFSVEQDIFNWNVTVLRDVLGVLKVEGGEVDTINIQGIDVTFGPKVVLYPSFAFTLAELKDKVTDLVVTNNSTLIVEGSGSLIKGLQLDGFLKISNEVVENKTVKNDVRVNYHALKEDEGENYEIIRGYTYNH
jgi:UDP-sugar pyrophosphorylase